MNNLSDETLNKYIDGELSLKEKREADELLANSPDDNKRLNALLIFHKEIKRIKETETSLGFTAALMKKLQRRNKSIKEQRNFILVMSSIFAAFAVLIFGFIIYSGLSQPQETQNSQNYTNILTTFFQSIGSITAKLFTAKGMSIFGSIVSLAILISGYFFFDSIKTSKHNLHNSG